MQITHASGHWCTPIPSQRLVFVLCVGNSAFFPKTSWNVDSPENIFPLSFGPSQMTLGPENLMNKWNKCLPLCIIQFQVVFLDAAADCVKSEWFYKVLPSPCGHVSIMVAWRFLKQYRLRAQWFTCIQQQFPPLVLKYRDYSWLPESFHDFMNCWWCRRDGDGERPKFFANLQRETLSLNWLTILSRSLAQSGESRHVLYLQRLSLWWMLLLYSVWITSPVTS